MVRVRFAPSPTGYLHIGNARTALFNYLFARKNKGKFILRIEDTDKERSKEKFEKGIIEDLKWFGIEWDEGPDIGGPFAPYRQSERLNIYREMAERLLKEGKAYKCFCTKEEIEERTEGSGYDGKCRNLTEKEIEEFEKEGKEYVLRFKVPEKETIVVNDLIRGMVEFETDFITDFIIMKSDNTPTFHFAVVVDDYLMEITHVIRGEDHLSNTPKHIMLFEAIGGKIPQFAHMSMTLGTDRTRLSKRHGATSVRTYREDGYLPEAFFNYIALLGFGTTEGQEIFTKEELIEAFSIERCHKANAIFDPEKLLWMNGYYIRNSTPERLLTLSLPFLKQAGLIKESLTEEEKEYLKKLIYLHREKIKTLKELPLWIDYFLKDEIEYEEEAVKKYLDEKGKEIISELLPYLEKCESFNKEQLENSLRKFFEENKYKTKEVFHPLRVALSGKMKGPGIFELLEFLGKEKVIKRMKNITGGEK